MGPDGDHGGAAEVDVREYERPLGVPPVDLEIIIRTQGEDGLHGVHDRVTEYGLREHPVRVQVLPGDGGYERCHIHPAGELVHGYDTVQLVVGVVPGDHGRAVLRVELYERVDHLLHDVDPGRLAPPGLVVADHGVRDAHGVGQLVLGEPELLPPLPDGLAGIRGDRDLPCDLLLELVNHWSGQPARSIKGCRIPIPTIDGMGSGEGPLPLSPRAPSRGCP